MANAKGDDEMKDDELVNEMLKPVIKNEIRAGYPVLTENHFFFQLVIEFMSDKRIWLGTVSELKKKGISVKFIRTNHKRLIELKK